MASLALLVPYEEYKWEILVYPEEEQDLLATAVFSSQRKAEAARGRLAEISRADSDLNWPDVVASLKGRLD